MEEGAVASQGRVYINDTIMYEVVGSAKGSEAAAEGVGNAVARTACNLMQLLQDPTFCAQKNEQLCKDVSLNREMMLFIGT